MNNQLKLNKNPEIKYFLCFDNQEKLQYMAIMDNFMRLMNIYFLI